MKNFVFTCSFMFMLVMLIPTSNVFASSFPDVERYQEQIDYLTQKGVIKGYPDGTFKPEHPVTRLQAVQMILNEKGINPDNYNAPDPKFKDVTPDEYGYNAIAAGADLSVIKGKQDGSFDPYGTVTRGQMAAILTNAYDLSDSGESPFIDLRPNEWPYKAVSSLLENGITKGYPSNNFKPYTPLSREHFSLFLAKAIHNPFRDQQEARHFMRNPYYTYQYALYEGSKKSTIFDINKQSTTWNNVHQYDTVTRSNVEEWYNEDGFYSKSLHYNYKEVYLKNPIKTGNSWTYNGKFYKIISTNETVNTRAKTFDNAVVVKSGEELYYYIQGLGQVKKVKEYADFEAVFKTLETLE